MWEIFFLTGIDLALRIAEKCLKKNDKEKKILSEEPLAWTMIHCPQDSVFMLTATLLLKLHFGDVMYLFLKYILYKNVQTVLS